jgi:hypothetical protein
MKPVLINGNAMRVTENLHTALTCLREVSGSRILWVDALCINQNDAEEKSQQVRIMNHIYRKAYRTLVFLGPEDEESTILYDFIEKEYGSMSWRRKLGDDFYKTHLQVILSLVKFLLRPWFTRI